MAASTHVPVALLGAGLTGLSAALALEERGLDYALFEREATAGGHATTVVEEGYRFDRTGHLLHLGNAATRARVLGWLDEEPLTVERRSAVWSEGVMTRYPYQANAFGLPPQSAYDCVMGFLKAARERAQGGAEPPTRFDNFARQSFGDAIAERFLLPYNERLWGVPASEITAEWCARFVPIPSVEDVIAGAVGLARRELGYNATFLYPRLGIGELPAAMARRARGLHLGRAPLALDPTRRELCFSDQRLSYDVLVSTAPLPQLLGLIEELPPAVASAAARLRATHLYYLDLALRRPCPHALHWVYVPEAKYAFYRVGCYSHFSPAMAPPGGAALYVELASREPPDAAALVPEVARSLVEMRFIEAESDVAFARVRRLSPAYVLYDRAHAEALGVIRPYLAEQGIVSTGRYGGWNYSSMEDALGFGEAAAAAAAKRLGGRT